MKWRAVNLFGVLGIFIFMVGKQLEMKTGMIKVFQPVNSDELVFREHGSNKESCQQSTVEKVRMQLRNKHLRLMPLCAIFARDRCVYILFWIVLSLPLN